MAAVCVLAIVCSTGSAQGRTRARRGGVPLASADRCVSPAPSRTLRGGLLAESVSRSRTASLWRLQRTPTSGPARVYGRTTSGCIAGAVELPMRGDGFVRRNSWRRTGFGHPDLVAYVRRLGEATRRAGLGGVRVGDMSLPRGGLYLHTHLSHQTGLDVDIAFRTLSEGPEDRALGPWRSFSVSPASPRPAGRHVEELLRLAAADDRVDRIFVAARIKQRLCRTAVGDRRFLDVLRPWQGHDRHFHVRLKCPADSPHCRPNERISSIPDDCEALSRWWKTAEALGAFAEWRAMERGAYTRALPVACQTLAEPAVSPALTARQTTEPDVP